MVQKKILAYSMVLIFLTGLITGVTSYFFSRNNYIAQEKQALLTLYGMVKETFHQTPGWDERVLAVTKFSKSTGVRVTLIEKDGAVAFDTRSQNAYLEDHSNRPEVAAAFSTGAGSAVRHSASEGKNYIYSAFLYSENLVVRLSQEAAVLDSLNVITMVQIFTCALCAFMISVAISVWFSRRLVRPLQIMEQNAANILEGGRPGNLNIKTGDEMESLAKALNQMTKKLDKNMKRVKSQNAQLEGIMNAIDKGLLAIDKKGRIMLINQVAKDMFCITQDISRALFSDFIRDRKITDFITGSAKSGQTELLYNEKIYSVRKNPISRGAGMIVMFSDITEMKKLENMRSEFVSNVTHELKTPLTSIKGFAETLKEGAIEDPKAAAHFLDIIEIEADRLSRLISDTLSLSAIETLKEDTPDAPVEFQDVVSAVYAVMKSHFEKKNIIFVKSVAPDIGPVAASGEKLQQVLLNLLSNAVMYNNPGGHVWLYAFRRNENFILQVKDDGIGIAKENLERIFERFYTVDKSRSKKSGGTGLGLSIVKHIALLYKGTVQAESKYGEGSCFTVTLPVCRCAAASSTANRDDLSSGGKTPSKES